MKLARAIKAMSRDPRLSCLAVVRDGATGYVELVRAGEGLQIRSGQLLKVSIPIRWADHSPSEKELIAAMATETEWTAFRGGVPLEDDEAPKVRRRR